MKSGLARMRSDLVAALDVGSSKTCCFIAELVQGRPRILGIGQQASHGVRSGNVVDMELCAAAIMNTVHAAEQMAGETIGRVLVNLSGGYPASSSVGVEVPIDGQEVAEGDLRQALQQGGQAKGVNGHDAQPRELIHSFPVGYAIDGSRGIRDPRGMYGRRLGVRIHVVTAAAAAVRNLTTCVQRCHLDVVGFVVSPYAAGRAALVEDEMELGVTVVDMGGGTTTIAVFFEGNPVYTDLVPIGGIHVTNDIARGLSTPVAHAERLKTLHGHAMAVAGENEMIDVPQVGEDADERDARQVHRTLLVGIIQPRLEETFELVRERLETSGFDKVAGRRVVLTGGASQLQGVRDLAALVLDKQVRLGSPNGVEGLAEATSGPAFATCTGLLACAAEQQGAWHGAAAPEENKPRRLMGRFGAWFRENF